MAVGIVSEQLASHSERFGGVTFVKGVHMAATDDTKYPFRKGFKRDFRVVGFGGIMRAAGAAGDTVTLQDAAGNAISNAIDVSALGDHDLFAASTIDDAYWDISKATCEGLRVVTASGAVCDVWATCVIMEDNEF